MVRNAQWSGTAIEINFYVFTVAEAPMYVDIDHDRRFVPICGTTAGIKLRLNKSQLAVKITDTH